MSNWFEFVSVERAGKNHHLGMNSAMEFHLQIPRIGEIVELNKIPKEAAEALDIRLDNLRFYVCNIFFKYAMGAEEFRAPTIYVVLDPFHSSVWLHYNSPNMPRTEHM